MAHKHTSNNKFSHKKTLFKALQFMHIPGKMRHINIFNTIKTTPRKITPTIADM